MSIQSEAERIKANVAATYAAAAELGADMPDVQNSDNLASTVGVVASEVEVQTDLMEQIAAVLAGKASGGGAEVSLNNGVLLIM